MTTSTTAYFDNADYDYYDDGWYAYNYDDDNGDNNNNDDNNNNNNNDKNHKSFEASSVIPRFNHKIKEI